MTLQVRADYENSENLETKVRMGGTLQRGPHEGSSRLLAFGQLRHQDAHVRVAVGTGLLSEPIDDLQPDRLSEDEVKMLILRYGGALIYGRLRSLAISAASLLELTIAVPLDRPEVVWMS